MAKNQNAFAMPSNQSCKVLTRFDHRCRDNKVSDIVFPRNSQFLSVIKDKNNALSLPFVYMRASVVLTHYDSLDSPFIVLLS